MTLTILLVHGAWHGAAHWAGVQAELERVGHRAIAIDLPGHGADAELPAGYLEQDLGLLSSSPSPVASVTLGDAADAVIAALDAHAPRGGAVLVGHSIGGAVITLAAERAPEKVGRLVYLAAYVPAGGRAAGDFGAMPEAQTGYGLDLFVADPAVIGAVRLNPRGSAEYRERVRQTWYHDVPAEMFRDHADLLTPDLPVSFWITGVETSAERWGRVPRSYIRTADDRATAPAVQDIIIAAADAHAPDNPFRVLTLPSSHSPFASMPARLADVLVEAAA